MILRKELVFKLDFVNWDFEIGWIWVILNIPTAYLRLKTLLLFAVF